MFFHRDWPLPAELGAADDESVSRFHPSQEVFDQDRVTVELFLAVLLRPFQNRELNKHLEQPSAEMPPARIVSRLPLNHCASGRVLLK